ncbi:MAG: fibronectin type III domain-containing protein [Boseongicola sp. SB0677_bin_26]|nr:fibronectin type III domain-containing protein [Boseongicola sp. SB0665_bin_10]MYG27189.1 fibronectin type III domain-containing protein [Boseongicola sp. SB0677_bin_26]
MTRPGSESPKVAWNEGAWSVRLPVDEGRQVVEATWRPGVTHVVRIREAGREDWSFGFETPLTSFTFVDLRPDTEYEVQVRTRTASGEGEPAFLTLRTGPEGEADNVVPFPRR